MKVKNLFVALVAMMPAAPFAQGQIRNYGIDTVKIAPQVPIVNFWMVDRGDSLSVAFRYDLLRSESGFRQRLLEKICDLKADSLRDEFDFRREMLERLSDLRSDSLKRLSRFRSDTLRIAEGAMKREDALKKQKETREAEQNYLDSRLSFKSKEREKKNQLIRQKDQRLQDRKDAKIARKERRRAVEDSLETVRSDFHIVLGENDTVAFLIKSITDPRPDDYERGIELVMVKAVIETLSYAQLVAAQDGVKTLGQERKKHRSVLGISIPRTVTPLQKRLGFVSSKLTRRLRLLRSSQQSITPVNAS